MDLHPFDGLVQELRSRREAVARHADELNRDLGQLGWEGPSADRFGEHERQLIADLVVLGQKLDAAMATAQQLVDEWNHDMAQARKMIHAFHGLINRVSDAAGEAVDSARDAINYDDWPVKPGDAIPKPGDERWQAFSGFMKARV